MGRGYPVRQAVGLLVAAATVGFSSLAAAQVSGSSGQPSQALPGGVPSAAGGEGGWLPGLIVIVGLLLVLGVAVKLVDLRNRREADAVQMQAQIADAFLRDRLLFGVPVVATAHVPLVKGSPMIIEVTGHAPTNDLAQAAVRLAAQEASRTRPDVQIVDRIEVLPSMAARAA